MRRGIAVIAGDPVPDRPHVDSNAFPWLKVRGSRRCAHPDQERRRACLDRLAKRDSEQARAEQHKAGCGYCEQSIGHEVMITHGTPRSVGHRCPPHSLEQNDMPRSAVNGISRCSENWNLTDALEQQLAGVVWLRREGGDRPLRPRTEVPAAVLRIRRRGTRDQSRYCDQSSFHVHISPSRLLPIMPVPKAKFDGENY